MIQRKIRKGATILEPVKWMNLEELIQVEVTSEDPYHPIDDALIPGVNQGWSATQSGEQTIRLYFHEPKPIQKWRLIFKEDHHQRTQEFALRWSPDGSQFKDILRQQYNFNPPSIETEEYNLNLDGVMGLELEINPSISGCATATLAELRLC